MAKNCTTCGNILADSATFCNSCGRAVPVEEPKAKKRIIRELDIKKILPVCGAVLVVALLLGLVFSLFAGGYKKPLDYQLQYWNGNFTNLEKMAPEEYWDYLKDKGNELSDAKDYAKEQQDLMSELLEDEYGKNLVFKARDIDKKKLSEKKLDNIRDSLKANYGISKKSVAAGYRIKFNLVIKGSADDSEMKYSIYVVKIDGKWYSCTENGTFGAWGLVLNKGVE